MFEPETSTDKVVLAVAVEVTDGQTLVGRAGRPGENGGRRPESGGLWVGGDLRYVQLTAFGRLGWVPEGQLRLSVTVKVAE